MKRAGILAATAGFAFAGAAFGVNFPETEANDSKATANVVAGMVSGDTITGNSTGSSTTTAGATSADYFRVQTAAAALGIYKHTLAITTSGTAGHSGSIRGLNQTGATAGVWDGVTVGTIGTTDTTLQSSSTTTTPARANSWYGFGKQEEVYYRVTGTTSTTADYVATLTTTAITPIAGPTTIPEGSVTIDTRVIAAVDTDMWVYDSNFNPIAGYGNDDESINGGGAGTATTSLLTRTFTPGDYYLAISRFNLANNLASPNDDDFRTGAVLDFPNAVLCTSTTTTAADMDVSIGGNVVTVLGAAATGHDVQFVQFTVVSSTTPTPPTGVLAFSPTSAAGGASTVASVTVTPGTNPASTFATTGTVSIDASVIDGSLGTINLLDNGVAPDALAGDNIFSATVNVPLSAVAQTVSVPFAIVDDQGRTGSGSRNFTVNPQPPACPGGTEIASFTNLESEGTAGVAAGLGTAVLSSGTVYGFNFTGQWVENILATFPSEARFRITAPSGNIYTFQPFTVTGGTLLNTSNTFLLLGAGQCVPAGEPAAGTWTFQAFESTDDAGSPDASWTTACFGTITTPPTTTPPTTTGNLCALNGFTVPGGSLLVADDAALDGSTIVWYTFSTRYACDAGNTNYVDITTFGTGFDSEIGLYRADGSLRANDDDDGDGATSQLSFGGGAAARPADGASLAFSNQDGALAAGTYYLAVGRFNTTFGACDFGATSTATGVGTTYDLTVRTNLPCPADVDDGFASGTPDGGVTIDDLIYYLAQFDLGDVSADVDDGNGAGCTDGGVTIDDLIYYLGRFDAGC